MKTLLKIAVLVSIITLGLQFGLNPILDALGFGERAGLRITASAPGKIELDGKEVGDTPYQNENLRPGEHQIKLSAKDGIWQGVVDIAPGTVALVNRDLREGTGEVVTLKKGAGAYITANSKDAEVTIDGVFAAKTPLSLPSLESGEHVFFLSADGFISRSIKATSPPGMRLSINADLALSSTFILSSPTPIPEPLLTVLSTPTGFLRVRDKASLSAKEVARVSSGDTLTLVEELPGWVKIKTKDGIEGYVSSQYIKKQ